MDHLPTGATVCILPAKKTYRIIRRHMVYPYGWTVEEMFGRVRHQRIWTFIKDIASYCSMSPISLSKALRQVKTKVIICQEYEYPRFDVCLSVGWLLGIPVVATFQGGIWQTSRLERFIRPRTIGKAGGLIVQSEQESQRIRGTYKLRSDRIKKIFNPIDLNEWPIINREKARKLAKIPDDIKMAVWHGRIDLYRKGLDILLDAWSLICRKMDCNKCLLIIVGNGRDQENFRRKLNRLQANNIKWVDEYILHKQRIRTYLSAADVYVFPSRHEGFPVAPLEAMACRIPVVASAAPGIAEILENGEADGGIMVPVENPERLADSVLHIFENPEFGVKLGAHARQRIINSFSITTVAEQIRCLLSTLESHRADF
jgi:starch synthase